MSDLSYMIGIKNPIFKIGKWTDEEFDRFITKVKDIQPLLKGLRYKVGDYLEDNGTPIFKFHTYSSNKLVINVVHMDGCTVKVTQSQENILPEREGRAHNTFIHSDTIGSLTYCLDVDTTVTGNNKDEVIKKLDDFYKSIVPSELLHDNLKNEIKLPSLS